MQALTASTVDSPLESVTEICDTLLDRLAGLSKFKSLGRLSGMVPLLRQRNLVVQRGNISLDMLYVLRVCSARPRQQSRFLHEADNRLIPKETHLFCLRTLGA